MIDTKTQRQRAIRAIVAEAAVSSQQDLAELLAKRGFEVTQATLSRDLRQLGIARSPTPEGYRYELRAAGADALDPAQQYLRSIAPLEVTRIECNEVSIIVGTLVGRAQGVAVHIDQLALDDVLGTIAGDDTILIIPRSVEETAGLARRLAEILGVPFNDQKVTP